MKFILHRFNIDIKQSEKTTVYRLFLQSFLTGLATSFFFVSTSSFFIKQLSLSQLPFAYILSGLVGYLIVMLYKKLLHHYGLIKSIVISSALYSIICIGLFTARIFGNVADVITHLVAFIGFVCITPFSSLFSLTYSTISLRIFNLAQSKRLLAFIGLGEVIASILAYLTIPVLVKILGSSHYLLLVTAVAILLSLIPIFKLAGSNPIVSSQIQLSKSPVAINFYYLWKDMYFLILGVCTLFSVIAIYLADYAYLLSVKFVATENNIETAIVVSAIFTVIKLGELLFSLFSSRFLNVLGMKLSLLILPLLLVGSAILGFTSGTIFNSVYIFIIAFLLLNKWLERVVRKGITVPSMRVLYQVTKPGERAKLQTLIDGSLTQVATIASGLILLLLSFLFKGFDLYLSLYILTGFCLFFYFLWLLFSNKLYSQYRQKIQAFLKNTDVVVSEAKLELTNTQQWVDQFNSVAQTDQEILSLVETVGKFNSQLQNGNAEFFAQQIIHYNPLAFRDNSQMEQGPFVSKCSTLLFTNENFLSRMSVIQYSRFLSEEMKFKLLRDNFESLSSILQYELLKNINQVPVQCTPADRFYFSGLCKGCIEDIVWIECSLSDIAKLDNIEIDGLLTNLREQKIVQLFQLFKILYDPVGINITEEIWLKRAQSTENEVFAVELLENILDSEMKKMAVPLLLDISLSAKKEKLNEYFFFNHLEPEMRLKDIVMKNFNLVDAHIKSLAVKAYVSLTGDASLLDVFKGNKNFRLASLSSYQNEKELAAYQAKLEMMTIHLSLPADSAKASIFDMFFAWGVKSDTVIKKTSPLTSSISGEQQNGEEREIPLSFGGIQYKIDCYGLCLFLNL